MPGVSMNTIWPAVSPRMCFTPRIRVRVVCGVFETIAIFVPMTRLSSVDLPAFGRPMSDANPVLITTAWEPSRSRPVIEAGTPAQADAMDASTLGVEHVHAQLVDLERLTDAWYATEP